MATITKFEDLDIWKNARKLCKIVHSYTIKNLFSKDFSLRDQVSRSSGSIMDNIAEGFGREGNNEFVHFLSISKGSSDELRSQSYRAFDFDYINEDELNLLLSETEKISAGIKSLMKYLKNSEIKGNKFKTK